MGAFSAQPCLEQVIEPRAPSLWGRIKQRFASPQWVNRLAFYYTSKNGLRIYVEIGDITNLASVPRLFWILLPPMGNYTPGAVIHDKAYEKGMAFDVNKNEWVHITKAQADAILKEAMEDTCTPEDEERLINWGLFIGGWYAWKQCRNLDPKNFVQKGST